MPLLPFFADVDRRKCHGGRHVDQTSPNPANPTRPGPAQTHPSSSSPPPMAITGHHSSDDHHSRRPVSWNQVVRGDSESDAVAPAPSSPSTVAAVAEPSPSPTESFDNGAGLIGGTGKRPAWNKPSSSSSSNVAASSEVSPLPVMDVVSWPALSASAKPESSSSKGLLDGSSSNPLFDLRYLRGYVVILLEEEEEEGFGPD